jgi:ankyrin repeat protein
MLDITDSIIDIIYEGEIEKLRNIVNEAGDVNLFRDKYGNTLLHHAIEATINNDDYKLIEYLINEEKADVNALNMAGICIYDIIEKEVGIYSELMQILVLSNRLKLKYDKLIHAFESILEDYDRIMMYYLIRSLILGGANVNTMDRKNRSLLHISVKKGNAYLITRFLLDKGADPNFVDSENYSALHILADHSARIDTFTDLVNYGISINHKNINGETARKIAINNDLLYFADRILNTNYTYLNYLSRTIVKDKFVLQKMIYWL